MTKNYCRISEVAEYLDVSQDQARKLIDTGQIEAISVHVEGASRQCIRVSSDALRVFIDSRKVAKPSIQNRKRRGAANSEPKRWV